MDGTLCYTAVLYSIKDVFIDPDPEPLLKTQRNPYEIVSSRL